MANITKESNLTKEEYIQSIESEKEELNKQISELHRKIEQRKQEAKDKELHKKLLTIAETLGEFSDWGGGEYFYSEEGLSIKLEYDYIKVSSGHMGKDLFISHRGDISLYIKGDWEDRIEPLLEKAEIKTHEEEMDSLIKKVETLKKEWEI